MPYFHDPKQNMNFLFIHIPKTGGTSIEDYFFKKKNIKRSLQSLFGSQNSSFNHYKIDDLKKASLHHQSYNSIMKNKIKYNINMNNLKVFAAVRNPYYRAISDLFYFKKIKPEYTASQVYNVLQKYIDSKSVDSHNIPQYLFVSDKNSNLHKNIFIMKTEKLNDDMKRYGFKDFDVVANINSKKHNPNNNNIYDKYLNNNSIRLINKVYYKDFKLFKYPMKKIIKPIIA
jgi:hypothetical protein